jgi:hypothetical protein
MKAKIVDVDGIVYTEATALFMKVNWGVANWSKIKTGLESKPSEIKT